MRQTIRRSPFPKHSFYLGILLLAAPLGESIAQEQGAMPREDGSIPLLSTDKIPGARKVTGKGKGQDEQSRSPGASESAAAVAAATPRAGAESAGKESGKEGQESEGGKTEAPPEEKKARFIKGELAAIGTFQLIPREDRIGVLVGYRRLGIDTFATVNPVIDLHFGKERQFKLGLGLPLNLTVFDSKLAGEAGDNTGFENVGKVREKDYDETSDYLKVIRYLTYGRKEDPFFLNVSSLSAATIGHGTLVRRYNANINVDETHVGAQFDAYWDWAGFQLYNNDMATWELAGFLGFFRPLGLFTSAEIPKSLSFGLTYFQHRNAPTTLKKIPSSEQGKMDLEVDDQFNPIPDETEFIKAYGIDAEFKFVKTKGSDIKAYVDWSDLADEGLGAGISAGLLGRFNTGEETIHAFRIRAEYRTFDANYVPSYFDTFYEITQYQFNDPGEDEDTGEYEPPLTKLEVLRSRGDLARRHGYYLELTYGILDAVSLGFAVEDSTANEYSDKNFMAHFEFNYLSWFQFFTTYYKHHPESFADIAKFSDNRTLFFSKARLQILPILFVNVGYQRSFALDTYEFEDITYASHFSNVADLSCNVELGFQF